MDKIKLGLVGCGGMGTRHLYGLRELAQTPFNNVELCAVCDIRGENAELAAVEVEKLLGVQPAIFTDLEEMAHKVPNLTAVDVVTDPSVHHEVACQAMDVGLHVMVEKPMAITVRACQKMIEAAERNDRRLSVAENYRRDPSARLVNHLMKMGAIGTPYMALFPCAAWGQYHSHNALATSQGTGWGYPRQRCSLRRPDSLSVGRYRGGLRGCETD